MKNSNEKRKQFYIRWVLGSIVIIPCFIGFGAKFLDLIELCKEKNIDGVFAFTPVINYLLASLGFLCLFMWGIYGGMFDGIEQPKVSMLETEALLDSMEQKNVK